MNFTYKWNLKDLEKVTKNGYKVFSFFAGGGGSSQGYKMAGYDVIGCNEIDPRQMEIYVHNLKPKYHYLEDIRTFRMREDLPGELYELDILDASFPCSLFSSANLKADDKKGKEVKFREGQVSQTLDDLAFETIKLVDKLKPKICVFENVKGLLNEKNKWYVEQIYKQFDDIGYKICHHLINCADLGVPQKRERVFFVATRKDIQFPNLVLNFNETPIKYGEIKDSKYKPLGKDTMIYHRWKKRVKSDSNLGDTVKRTENGKISSFNTQYLKDDRVPNTIAAGGSLPVRFDVPGYATERDIKIIQTFPQDYDFLGSNVQYICGMSVPPIMMKKISEQVKIQLLDKLLK